MGPNIQITSGPTGQPEDHELFFARRALKVIKERLGNHGLIKLLAPDTTLADEYWERIVRESNGQFTGVSITLMATGNTATEFMTWFKINVPKVAVMLASHPEHYTHPEPVLETIGEWPTYVNLEFQKEPAACVKNLDKERYPLTIPAAGKLRSGTVLGHACHQLRDFLAEEGKGLEACFGVYMPAACGEEVLETHRRHLTVEWTNWLKAAHAEIVGS